MIFQLAFDATWHVFNGFNCDMCHIKIGPTTFTCLCIFNENCVLKHSIEEINDYTKIKMDI